MGSYFHVDSNGKLYAVQGEIGGWQITSDALKGGNMTIKSDGSMSGSNWSIGTDGAAKFTNQADFSDARISGGNMSGGTIGGKADMNGGTISGAAMTGGTIDASKVKVGDKTLEQWCKNIVSESVKTAFLASYAIKCSKLTVTGSSIKVNGITYSDKQWTPTTRSYHALAR